MRRAEYATVLAALLVLLLVLVACQPQESDEDATNGGGDQAEQELVSVKTDANPTLDGVGDEAVWQDAPETEIKVSGGENDSATDVRMKSVYTDTDVSFLIMWDDPTESFLRSPWEKQEDGSWMQLSDPDDEGGDNNLWYEDKMSMIWPIDDSIPDFAEDGCNTVCHEGEDEDIKPYGNKYTDEEGQTGDIWHLKTVRNLDQVDDQYLDSTRLDPNNLEETREAGRHSDPNDGGGYKDNKSEEATLPAFMLPDASKKDGSPGFILDSEKVPFDDSGFQPGDRVPGIVIAQFTGDRADLDAKWEWADGVWTLELTRSLVTDSEFDVQFDDLNKTYYFGTAIFDNAQVRHADQTGSTPFVFQTE